MKHYLVLTVFMFFMIFLTACNNVNKQNYNSNSSDNSFLFDSEVSDTVYNEDTQNDGSTVSNLESGTEQGTASSTSNHTHQFEAATCTAPKTCSVCGATEGEPAGHRWAAANCMYPKTCIVCKTADNKLGEHIYNNGICNICGNLDSNIEYVPLNSTDWVANLIDDTILHQFIIRSDSKTNYYISYSEYVVASETANEDGKSTYNYNGVKYVKTDTSAKNAISIEEIRNSIYITDDKERHLVLERFSEDVIKITEIDENFLGYENLLRVGIDFSAKITE